MVLFEFNKNAFYILHLFGSFSSRIYYSFSPFVLIEKNYRFYTYCIYILILMRKCCIVLYFYNSFEIKHLKYLDFLRDLILKVFDWGSFVSIDFSSEELQVIFLINFWKNIQIFNEFYIGLCHSIKNDDSLSNLISEDDILQERDYSILFNFVQVKNLNRNFLYKKELLLLVLRLNKKFSIELYIKDGIIYLGDLYRSYCKDYLNREKQNIKVDLFMYVLLLHSCIFLMEYYILSNLLLENYLFSFIDNYVSSFLINSPNVDLLLVESVEYSVYSYGLFEPRYYSIKNEELVLKYYEVYEHIIDLLDVSYYINKYKNFYKL